LVISKNIDNNGYLHARYQNVQVIANKEPTPTLVLELVRIDIFATHVSGETG
jgi:hypothetical protein